MRRLATAAVLASLALAGCASPEPAYYTLATVPGPVQGGGPRLVEMRRVSLAGYLDRHEVVLADHGFRLDVAQGTDWAEPLGDMIGRVLAEDLTQRLPGTTVFREATGVTARPDATLNVTIQRFDRRDGGPVTLQAQLVLERGGRTRAETVTLAAPPAPVSAAGTAADMSRLLGELADRIALMLRR